MRTLLRLLLTLVCSMTMIIIVYQSIALFTNNDVRDATPFPLPSFKSSKVINHEITLSEKNDIITRSNFQKLQIEKYCALVGVANSGDTSTVVTTLYQHLVYSDQRRAILCNIRNTGSADLKKLFNIGNKGHSTLKGHSTPNKPLKGHSTLNKTLKADKEKLEHYYKIMFVRNPLERLVYSYRDSIAPPISNLSSSDLSKLKWEIFERYRPIVYHHWLETGGGYEIFVTFPEFVEYYLDEVKETVFIDVRPLPLMCEPCQVKYNFYGDYNSQSQDTVMVIDQVGFKRNNHKKDIFELPTTNQTVSLLEDYYRRLTFMQRARLYDRMKEELSFYYHLYPRARHSHVTLLGIEDQLYTVTDS